MMCSEQKNEVIQYVDLFGFCNFYCSMTVEELMHLTVKELNDIVFTAKQYKYTAELLARWLEGIQKLASTLEKEGN